jgi:hypothetical protein
MLKDEYNRLIQLFRDGAEGKPINLAEVFSQSLEFFQHLKEQMQEGGPEEKKEAMAMMTELYQQMMTETRKITEKSGLTEEQLMAYAENPANFSADQWRQIQDSKQKIAQAGQDLSKVVQHLTQGAPPPGKEGDKDHKDHKGKKGKKSQWMRS